MIRALGMQVAIVWLREYCDCDPLFRFSPPVGQPEPTTGLALSEHRLGPTTRRTIWQNGARHTLAGFMAESPEGIPASGVSKCPA